MRELPLPAGPVQPQLVRSTSWSVFLGITIALTLLASGGTAVLVTYGSQVGSVPRGLPLAIASGAQFRDVIVVPRALPGSPSATATQAVSASSALAASVLGGDNADRAAAGAGSAADRLVRSGTKLLGGALPGRSPLPVVAPGAPVVKPVQPPAITQPGAEPAVQPTGPGRSATAAKNGKGSEKGSTRGSSKAEPAPTAAPTRQWSRSAQEQPSDSGTSKKRR